MIDSFLREKTLECSPRTVENYQYTFKAFDPLGATEDDIQTFLLSAPSRSTASLHFRHLRSFYNWAVRRGIINESPMRYLRQPRGNLPVVQPYSDDEINRMLAVSRHRGRLIITLLNTTGIRRGEAVRLTRNDVLPDCILIRGKGNKERYVPLGDRLKALLIPWRPDPLFDLTPHGLYEAVATIGQRAGVHAWPHRFRDTFAVRYLEKGGAIDNLQVLLGHAHISMTLRYVMFGRQQRALAEARRLAS